MKSFKNLIAGTLVFTMMLAALTSCSTKDSDDLKVRTKDHSSEDSEETEITEEPDVTVTSEPVKIPEPTEIIPEPTYVPENDFYPEFSVTYLADYNEEKDQSVILGNIYLSDETIDNYPELASCIDSFHEVNDLDMLYNILDNLPDADGTVHCDERINVARADDQIFSFSVHYRAYTGNPNDGVLFDYIEAYSYDVSTGHEYTYEDIFNLGLTEDEYVYKTTGVTLDGDVYYLIGHNGVTVIAEKEGGYDPNNPFSTLTYTEYFATENSGSYCYPDLFSVEDCVIRNFGWDMDFYNNISDETSLETVIQDPYTGKILQVQITFTPSADTESTNVDMTVTDLESSLKIAHAEFANYIFSSKVYLFCNGGNYSLALQFSGYDDETYVNFLQFTGDNQIGDPVIVEGYLTGYATDFSTSPYASDRGLCATVCNDTLFIYFEKRIDLLGTYDYLDRYVFKDNMIPEDVVDMDRALTNFGLPLVTKIDYEFNIDDNGINKETLPAGTEFYIYSVNPETRTIILQTGSDFYFLKFDDIDDSLQNKIDGTPDTDLFEVVYYSYGL